MSSHSQNHNPPRESRRRESRRPEASRPSGESTKLNAYRKMSKDYFDSLRLTGEEQEAGEAQDCSTLAAFPLLASLRNDLRSENCVP